MSQEKAKEAAGRKAAELIESGMIVGLGSGSTALCFIQSLCERCKEGLRIEAVASSRESASAAQKGGLRLIDFNAAPGIDLTVDGADEIDGQKRMIKGGGGAHVREKILASSSREMVVIIDESKRVEALGRVKLPVEVLYYGSPATRRKIEEMGYKGKWRMSEEGSLFLTENGNLLFDIALAYPVRFPEKEEEMLRKIPGVVDTGFFFHLAKRVITGFSDGRAQIW